MTSAAQPPSGVPRSGTWLFSGVAATFAVIVGDLRRAAAARAPRHALLAPLIVLLWRRWQRAMDRFSALAARADAGTLKPPRRRPPRAAPKPARATDAAPSAAARPQAALHPRLPRGTGWLVRHLPEAAGYGSQLRHLLDQPETQALLRQAPQAGRLLRPLCRMLAVPLPEALLLPPRPGLGSDRGRRCGLRQRPQPGPPPPARPPEPCPARIAASRRNPALRYIPGMRPITLD